MQAIILAGGKGTRLKPYTTVLPKPLVPLGNYSILEIVIRQLANAGITDIILAVNHLSEIIMAFFGDGRKWGVSISYSLEEKPLGTAGPLKLVDDLQETFFILNGDLLCDLNFNSFLEFHKEKKSNFTFAIYKRKMMIDFGVIEFDDLTKTLISHSEKPVMKYQVGMGICLVNRPVVDIIHENQKYDLPDLARDWMELNHPVYCYEHEGYWLDIGRPEDYDRANHEFETIKHKLGL